MRASQVLCGAAAMLVIVAAASRPSSAAPARTQRPLILTSFVQSGRTDVWRNETLEFRFSTPLRKGSVTDRTLRIGQVQPDGLFLPAEGARIVTGNVVRFVTRRTQANYDASQQRNAWFVEADRPEGLMAFGTYTVRVPAALGSPTLKSRDGRAIVQPFTATFVTNNQCADPEEGQPSFVGDHGTGLLGFDPPRSGPQGLVEAGASIVIEFSEPVLSTSLVPGATVLVTRRIDGAPVAGSITADPWAPSGRRYLFTPTAGFGSDAAGQGADVVVRLTTGITDIAGNPLQRAFGPAEFRTRAAQ
jgi:hypothetical protein